MKLSNVFTKPHPDDEYVDGVTIDVAPRYKQSELSGDEWRVSAVMQFWRKGRVVWEKSFGRMEVAAMALPWYWKVWMEEDFKGLPGWDENLCFQAGCFDRAVIELELKQEFSRQGEGPLPDSVCKHRRKFCARHKVRGDSDREDCDDNYIKIRDIEPEKDCTPEKFSRAEGEHLDINEPNVQLAGGSLPNEPLFLVPHPDAELDQEQRMALGENPFQENSFQENPFRVGEECTKGDSNG